MKILFHAYFVPENQRRNGNAENYKNAVESTNDYAKISLAAFYVSKYPRGPYLRGYELAFRKSFRLLAGQADRSC